MTKEQQELLDKAYENYVKIVEENKELYLERDGYTRDILTKDEFKRESKYNYMFSEKWGLTIEERELSDEERMKTLTKNEQRLIYERVQSFKNVRSKKLKDFLDEQNNPTKLITIKYNDKTIESYE